MAKRNTRKIFIEKSLKIHGNKYDYSMVEYINNSTKVCIICPIHGKLNAEMSEREMCKELGLYKIWNCGLLRYLWKSCV